MISGGAVGSRCAEAHVTCNRNIATITMPATFAHRCDYIRDNKKKKKRRDVLWMSHGNLFPILHSVTCRWAAGIYTRLGKSFVQLGRMGSVRLYHSCGDGDEVAWPSLPPIVEHVSLREALTVRLRALM